MGRPSRALEVLVSVRIFISGNAGYVGDLLVGHLQTVLPRADIIGFDSGLFLPTAGRSNARSDAARAPNRQLFGDVRDLTAADLRDVDAVVCLSAISNDPMGNRFAAATDAINHAAAVRLAGLAREAGVRHFVFASSCSVYGAAGEAPRRETDPVNPLTAYARSKIAAEQDLAASDLGDMTVTCLRFATACGLSNRLRLDLVLNDFVAGAIAERSITVLSDGTPWRPLIDVADMARAIEWAISRGGERFLIVNTGADHWNFQVSDLAEAVAAEIPGTAVSINRMAPPDRRSYRVDFSRFASLAPDHQPITTLSLSIRRLRDGLIGIGFADANFRHSPLMRLNMLTAHLAAGRLDQDLCWVPRRHVAGAATR